jgi:predicted transposase YbfD/YdcC
MDEKQSPVISDHFKSLPDPRINRTKKHKLIDIVVIAICSVICHAESWEDIQAFAETRSDWFKTFLELPHGIPSHDTIARVFSRLDPAQFQQCFLSWIKAVSDLVGENIVAIDGKTLRRSFDNSLKKSALHLVSAWSCTNHIVLGQVKVDDKSNEITAIPKLLTLLSLKGCLVTLDAMGCQKGIAEKIVDQGSDYIIAALRAIRLIFMSKPNLYLMEQVPQF